MTKKLFFVVLCMGLFSHIAKAQVEDFEIGIKLGLNIADVRGDEVDDLDPRTSIHIGLAAEIPINEYIGLQPELLYSFQGFSAESFEPNFEEENLKLDYIYLPIMVKYYPFYVVPGFSIEAGPQVGILTSAVLERKNTFEGGVTETSDVDFDDFVSDVDVAINIGLGYQFEMGAFFQARYNLGVTNIIEIGGVELSRQFSVFQFSTGIKF
ncbi:PorT family protein [Aquimarina sp. U1-2]|uniref:porin family protein n=1 Tax=Aquimarina sp. U1-2 TaxID=2823141 RepID=UPI001AECFB08|nr:porin family protein [Aquimarina sp. U1-2]MBP2832045.1 PorT family protein [Aquimarina sp. U1-2]